MLKALRMLFDSQPGQRLSYILFASDKHDKIQLGWRISGSHLEHLQRKQPCRKMGYRTHAAFTRSQSGSLGTIISPVTLRWRGSARTNPAFLISLWDRLQGFSPCQVVDCSLYSWPGRGGFSIIATPTVVRLRDHWHSIVSSSDDALPYLAAPFIWIVTAPHDPNLNGSVIPWYLVGVWLSPPPLSHGSDTSGVV